MNQDEFGLNDAYSVVTPEDNRALYRDWADTYETGYMQAHGYVYHRHVVQLFLASAEADTDNTRPVLDVGCGTGVAGVELADAGDWIVDGIDISPEMLDHARAKGVYRLLTEVDVTQPLSIQTGSYGGVISSGTFTHGHLGPAPFGELVRVSGSGGRFAIGINAEHFQHRGFDATLRQLTDAGLIDSLELHDVPMYDAEVAHEHAHDRAIVPTFRRI